MAEIYHFGPFFIGGNIKNIQCIDRGDIKARSDRTFGGGWRALPPPLDSGQEGAVAGILDEKSYYP